MRREHPSIMLMRQYLIEYYRVFEKQIKSLSPEPQLSDFYHLSEAQKNGEILFVAVSTGIAAYALYKYLK